MDLQFDRKEIFFIGVILLLILAWTLGNLSVAYFGMEDEDIGGETEEPDYANGETAAFEIPVQMVRYFYYGILVAGVASIFLSPKDDIIETLEAHLPRLAFIGFFFFLPNLLPYIVRFGSWLEQTPISDIELPSLPDFSPENGSQSIVSSLGFSIGILILLGSILVILYFIIKHEKLSVEEVEPEEDISLTADKAITELHEGDDIRDVIMRNYQKMLIILEEKGVEQDISFTPREMERIALDRLPLKEDTIDEMTRLFEEAKYSDHPLGKEERDRAIDNFKQIREELESEKDG